MDSVHPKLVWVYEDHSGKSFLSDETEFSVFLASILQSIKFYPFCERILFCTENIKRELEHLNLFDRIDAELLSKVDEVDRNLFLFSPKIKVIKELSAPFLLMDCDFYLLKKVDFSGDLIVSYLEDEEFYQYVYADGRKIFEEVGIEPTDGRRAYNASFLYMGNENFRKKYSEKVWDWMVKLSKYDWNDEWMGGYSPFCEQKLLYDMSVEEDLKVECLVENPKISEAFVHLGEEKRTKMNFTYRLEEVRKIIKEFETKEK
jgi:hypothetical protein